MKPQDLDRLRTLTERLCGASFWGAARTVDMAEFSFGERRERQGPRGVLPVGSLVLHVQCAWRIVAAGQTFVGWRDLYLRRGHGGERATDAEIDGRETRLDERFAELFSGAADYRVHGAEVGDGGSLRVSATGDLSLEIMPSDSTDAEQWRIFSPDKDWLHAVVLGTGLEPAAP